MQFGIMAMQLQSLIPAGVPTEQLVSGLAGFKHADLVRSLMEQGFKLIELGGDLGLFFPQAYSKASIQELLALKQENGIEYTVHLPLWSVEPSTPLQPVRMGSVQAIVETIRSVQLLQPGAYVLHATGALAAEFYRMHLPDLARSLILRQFQAGARQSIETVLAETGIEPRRLAIETIEFPLDLTLELAEELNLSICLDTGHVLAGFSGEAGLFEVVERILPRLGEIHLHDSPAYLRTGELGYGKDHQALGKGDLDTGRLLDRLSSAGWSGPIIFELNIAEALESMQVIQSLRPTVIR